MARGRERNFEYYTPTYEDTIKLAEKRSTFISLFKDVKIFRPKQGTNLIRILPGTWPGARHYGLFIRVHREIGPRDQQYLCLKQNNEYLPEGMESRCPICDALSELGMKSTDEERRKLSTREAAVYYIIDRENERDGIQVWQTSNATSSEIATQSTNSRTRAVLNITHPDEGYDLEFTRAGTGINTRYRGYHIMRESTPLSDSDRDMDRLLDELLDKPLPSILNFYSYDHIQADFLGKVVDDSPRRTRDEGDSRLERRRSREEEEEQRPRRSRQVEEDDEEEEPPPRRRSRAVEEDEEPPPRKRTQLSEDIDDEVPSNGGRRAGSNGRDDEEEEKPRPRRARMTEPEPDDDDAQIQRARDRMRLRREREQRSEDE